MVESSNSRMNFKCVSLVLLFSLFPVGHAGRVLVIVLPTFNHIQPLIPTLEELNERYGHQSTIIVREETQLVNTSIDHIIPENLKKFDENLSWKLALKQTFEGQSLYPLLRICSEVCELLLEDTSLLVKLRQKQFDLVLVEKSPFTMCWNIIAYNLSLPFMHVGFRYDPINDRIPFLPSFVPAPFTGYSDKMNFYQRLVNSFAFLTELILPDILTPSGAIEKFAPQKPPISTTELWSQVQFTLYDMDVLLDYPRPIQSNCALVGGIGTRPARPLTGKLNHFISSSQNELVIVSFGSGVSQLPENIVDNLTSAFKRVESMNFVFRYGNSTVIDKNILIMPWIPQNDLLGHPKTKLFITHCGNSGQFEALYHGVPMLGFPLFFDQPYNALRMVSKGFGISMDIKNFEIDELVRNIYHMLENTKYSKAIKLASEIFRGRPQSPKEIAAYWIDHVMKYGVSYMRPASLDLSFFQYILLDVMAVLLVVIVATICSLIYMCKLCRSCITGNQKLTKIE